MNKDELKGKLQNIKGRMKDAAGSLTGDKGKQADGMVDRAAGAAREKLVRRARRWMRSPKTPRTARPPSASTTK